MTEPGTILLIAACAALVALGVAGWVARRAAPAVLHGIGAGLCALALVALPAAAVDALALAPLVVLFGTGAATFAAAGLCPALADRRIALLGPVIACLALALAAPDAPLLILGTAGAGVAAHLLRPTASGLARLFGGLVCLLLALDVLVGAGWHFAAIRTAPPDGWRAAVLLLGGIGWLAALAWPRTLTPLPGALLTATLPAVVAGLGARLLLDLAGPAQPAAFAVPVLLLGGTLAAAGAWQAIAAGDLGRMLAGASGAQAGMAVLALGVVVLARAADQPELAGAALAALLAQAAAQGGALALLLLGAAALRHYAGSDTDATLGGLMQTMPRTAAGLLAGVAALCCLPLSAGFPGLWLLLQSLFSAARLSGTGLGMLAVAAALIAACAAALLAVAALRLVGIGLLGLPRAPRTISAEDPPRRFSALLSGLAALLLVLGLWPAPLFALAGPAVGHVTGLPYGLGQTWLALAPPLDGAGYCAPGLAALVGGLWAIAALIRRDAAPARMVPAWNDGLDLAQGGLPIGDLALQLDPAAFTHGLTQTFAGLRTDLAAAVDSTAAARAATAWRVWRPLLLRHRVALGLAALFVLLLALALIETA